VFERFDQVSHLQMPLPAAALKDGKMTGHRFRMRTIDETILPDPKIAALIEKVRVSFF